MSGICITIRFIKNLKSQALVAHTCNPSYSGGNDQEHCSLKLTWANSSARPYLEKQTLHKKGLVEWLKVKALGSNPSTTKNHLKKTTCRYEHRAM
jgi:hypothetical protein